MGKSGQQEKRRGSRLFSATASAALILSGAVHNVAAQVATPEVRAAEERAAQERLRRQEERIREQQYQLQPKADVLSPAADAATATELPLESPCFVLREISLTGAGISRFSWLQEQTLPFLNRCIGVQGLSRIASVLDAKLIKLGYATTRVSLPQQNLQSGKLELVLHVGRIATVRMVKSGDPAAAAAADDNWGTWRNAFPGLPALGAGDILNIRDLEQGVEQMKRLPSQTVATRIEPGVDADTSNIVIERQSGTLQDRIRGGITVDNSGSESLGRAQLASYLAIDNPLGINDILNLSANSNLSQPEANHRSQSLAFNYSLPFGYNTFTLSDSVSRFAQMVQATTARFLSSGSSETAEFKWHRTIVRTASAKFGLYAGVLNRRANSYLDDVELVLSRRRTTSLEAGVTYKKLIAAGELDLDLGYRRGMPWFNAEDDMPQGGPTTRPQIWSLDLNYSQPFSIGPQPLQYNASLHGQSSNDTLLAVDQIAIGSRYSVRGFDGNSVLLADSGFYLRNELAMPAKLIAGVDTQLYAGLDLGRVWGPNQVNLIGNKLAGAAIGVRGKWQALQLDASLGTPLYQPAGFKTHHVNPYVALTYGF
ncbi:ShlB/FhaC/HecB family hemolysin secretion/activation protein [Paraherbaspirillum soli]|uniref:ShlB/FhaC/HecB family hemolysin secretion/activation protein n=1 Tax=Paraherbaspirillum soli TaxID=631222 RepID=A0ABW0M664_9BURK